MRLLEGAERSGLHEMRALAAAEAAAEFERHERHAAMAAAGITIRTHIDGRAVPDGTADVPGSTVSGSIDWQVTVAGTPVERVEFRVDANTRHPNGILPLSVEHYAPYQFNGDPDGRLDTTKIGDGVHKLGVRVYASKDAKKPVASAACWVKVANTTPPPPPPPPPPPLGTGQGRVRFCEYTSPASDQYTNAPSDATKQWMRDHWDRAIVYANYWDSRLSWYANGWAYVDPSAIYTSSVEASQHPDWILKDAAGNKLKFYSDVQYAADIGNPAYVAYRVAQVKALMQRGYRGVHLDDMNLDRIVVPNAIDPRTGQTMTFDNWRLYYAELAEAMRAACPPPFEIVHNALWWADFSNAYVLRQIKASTLQELERGFADQNYTPAKIEQLWAWIDKVHALGVRVNHLASPASTQQAALFNVCCALMVAEPGDYQYANYGWQPTSWWNVHDTDLGDATGPRYSTGTSKWVRDFVDAQGKPRRVSVDLPAKTGTIA